MISASTLLYIIYFFAACAIILTLIFIWDEYNARRQRSRRMRSDLRRRQEYLRGLPPHFLDPNEPSWGDAAAKAASLIIPVLVLLVGALAITPN